MVGIKKLSAYVSHILCSQAHHITMEALKAEIASKRKAIQDDPIDRPSKYMKRGDLERLREEQELASRQVQTSPEGPPSNPSRVSIRSSFDITWP